MIFNQRDIVLIPIPFTNPSSSKRRPVIIISENEYNHSNPDVIVVAITSNLKQRNKSGIDNTDTNLETGQLPLKSRIRYDKIYTLSKKIIIKKFFRINKETFNKVEQQIHLLISLSA